MVLVPRTTRAFVSLVTMMIFVTRGTVTVLLITVPMCVTAMVFVPRQTIVNAHQGIAEQTVTFGVVMVL